MARISKKVRAYAADLLSAAAFESAQLNKLVFLGEISAAFLADEPLDLYQRDQIELVAAVMYRESALDPSDYGGDFWPQCYVDTYLEAAARLREGHNPNLYA